MTIKPSPAPAESSPLILRSPSRLGVRSPPILRSSSGARSPPGVRPMLSSRSPPRVRPPSGVHSPTRRSLQSPPRVVRSPLRHGLWSPRSLVRRSPMRGLRLRPPTRPRPLPSARNSQSPISPRQSNQSRNHSRGRVELVRDLNGRYKSMGPRTIKKVAHARQQRASLAKRKELKMRLHEDYLHSFCLNASREDSLPASRSSGPLVEIFQAVLLKSFILGKPARYQQTKQFYMDVCRHPENSSADSVASSRRNSSNSGNLPANLKKYKGCRLPILSRRLTEMARVRAWVNLAHDNKALAYSVERAMDLVEEIIDRFSSRSSKTLQATPTATAESSLCSNCDVRILEGSGEQPRIFSLNQPGVGVGEPENQNDCEPSPTGGVEDVLTRTLHDDNAQQPRDAVEVSEAALTRGRKLQAVLETAKVDENYIMLCMLFDSSRETEFGSFARDLLDQQRRQGIRPTNLMKEVLLLAQSRWVGTVDTTEHKERERRLKLTLTLFDAAREAIKMPLYTNMTWSF